MATRISQLAKNVRHQLSKVPDDVKIDELAPVARRVLLNGLIALEAHRDAITVVGAQAVHLLTEHVPITTGTYTSDGDLGLDPALLPDEPLIQKALLEAGFERLDAHQAGLWFTYEEVAGKSVPVELDLLIGTTLAETGRRSVRIDPHDKMAARAVPGLETAVVDRQLMVVTALEESDSREIAVHVAGPAALFVAKSHKLHDRLAGSTTDPGRLHAKDAGDVYRLMAGTRPSEVALRFEQLLEDDRVGAVTATGLAYLREQFGGRDAPGVRLAVEALAGVVPESTIRGFATAYVAALPGN
ncbi:hypothetical protein [Amycolatopsis sp. SID8362]|uniref:hypothetical protein n=1 Tax=Amycolatopsis sp. SID8362 TaxID=2690346 RepID=UPI0019408430|nr:hypothetical protein [Amycolatopsis sp. SID8362]